MQLRTSCQGKHKIRKESQWKSILMIKYLNDSQMLIVGCRCFVEIGWEQRNSPLISIPSHIILGFENIQHSSFYHRMYSSGWAKQSSYLFTYNCSRTVVAEGKVPQFLKPSPVVGNQCQSKIASSSLQHMAAKRIRNCWSIPCSQNQTFPQS